MVKHFKQLRGKSSGENILLNGEKVISLGIQAKPNTIFTINDGSEMKMGYYGIYELDLTGLDAEIISIRVKDDSAIIDIVYEEATN